MSSWCLIVSLNVIHLTKHASGLDAVLNQQQRLQCLWGGGERSRWQQNNAIRTGMGGHGTAWCSLMQHRIKSSLGGPIISCLNLLPEWPVKADCFAPWHLQRDIAWRAWEGEPGCHSGHCWEDYLRLEVTRPLMVRAWWPPLSSWPPGGCSPWLQFLRWYLGCPARPISPKTLVPALPSFGVGLTLVLSYNRLHNKHTKQSMFTSQQACTCNDIYSQTILQDLQPDWKIGWQVDTITWLPDQHIFQSIHKISLEKKCETLLKIAITYCTPCLVYFVTAIYSISESNVD